MESLQTLGSGVKAEPLWQISHLRWNCYKPRELLFLTQANRGFNHQDDAHVWDYGDLLLGLTRPGPRPTSHTQPDLAIPPKLSGNTPKTA